MRIIVVDDEMITRVSLKNFICSELPEYIVAGTFTNGREALEYLSTHPVDVVITDIRMPLMDGLELSRMIQTTYPNTMVIIISGYSEFEYAKQALQYNVSNYLLKPIDFDQLTASLKNCHRTISQLQTMSQEIDYSTEEYELFFIDLLTHGFSSEEELKHRFWDMKFPFSLDKSAGFFLRLSCPGDDPLTSQWIYGRETLSTALFNMVRMTFPETIVYLIMRTRYHYDFVVITEQEPGRLDTGLLLDHIAQNLHLHCSIDSVSFFSSLEKFMLSRSNKTKDNLPDFSGSKTVQDEDGIISKAISFIETHYAMDLTREDVADAVFLSSAYFSRFFKQKTGMSFLNFLTTVRMKKAIELLGTRMKINDIAKAVGYQSRNRFFINFRQYTSYSPTEYRRFILKMKEVSDETT